LRHLSRQYLVAHEERPAGRVNHIVRVAVITMAVLLVLESTRWIHQGSLAVQGVFMAVNITVFCVLAADVLARFAATPCRRFFDSLRNWIDLVSVTAYFLSFFLPSPCLAWLRPIQSLRILTMFRVRRASSEIVDLHVVIRALSTSLRPIRSIALAIIYLLFISAVSIYWTEHQVWDAESGLWMRHEPRNGNLSVSPFQNIVESMWFSVVTLTTTGYGDAVPYSRGARTMAALTMLFGVLTTALAVSLIASASLEASMKHAQKVRQRMQAPAVSHQRGHERDTSIGSIQHISTLPSRSRGKHRQSTRPRAWLHRHTIGGPNLSPANTKDACEGENDPTNDSQPLLQAVEASSLTEQSLRHELELNAMLGGLGDTSQQGVTGKEEDEVLFNFHHSYDRLVRAYLLLKQRCTRAERERDALQRRLSGDAALLLADGSSEEDDSGSFIEELRRHASVPMV